MGSHDRHGDVAEVNERNVIITIFLNFVITAVEVVGGLVSGSLSLLSDALHNFSDALAILVSYAALKLSRRASTPQKTFGYKRAQILAALLNAAVLIVIAFFLFKEAVERLGAPVAIDGRLMGAVAVVGLLANLLAVLLLHRDAAKNINIRSAYLHLMADTLSSVAVVLGSLLVYFGELYWVDPVLTMLIGIYILKKGYGVLKESVNILMQSTPAHLDVGIIKGEIEKIEAVLNCHHIHLWQLDDRQVHFEAHIKVAQDYTISQTDEVIRRIESLLRERFAISHVTLQFEYEKCDSPRPNCE
jgi:cobalt-zinc-cadmium efflux system protein